MKTRTRDNASKAAWLCTLVSASLLFGCAGEKAHRQGLAMIEQGQVEQGLEKLQQATREAPDNLSFRADLINRRAQTVTRMLALADSERAAGRVDEAEVLYERVFNLERGNARAKAGLAAVEMDRRHIAALEQAQSLFAKGELENARTRLQPVLLENPNHADAKALQHRIEEQSAKAAATAPVLKSQFKKPVTLQFRDANLKMVFEALSRSSGINILLDKDVKNDLKTTIFVKEVSVEDTIDLVLMQNQLEKKILNDNTVFIYPNTPAKVKDYQDLVIRSFHLTNADAKQMLAMIKTVLKTKDLFLDEKTNSLVMRDTPDAVRLAEKLVAGQDIAEPEAVLEVEVLEVKRSRLTQLGIKFPDQVTLTASQMPATTTRDTTAGGAVVTTTTPAAAFTLQTLKNINSGNITVSPLSVAIDLKKEDGDANLLASPRIRVKNKEKAKIHVGDRVPVITNTVTPVASGSPVVTGSVQYVDVGLKLDVEPNIHLDGDVAIKTNLEVSSIVKEITTTSGTLAYQIGTRSASTVLRLKDGETQVLAGLINDEDRKSASKLPGFGDLPVLGRLFSSHRDTSEKTEIILSITPRIIRNPQRMDAQLVEFWSGTEATLRSKPLTLQPVGRVASGPAGAPATPPQGRQAPRVTPLPGPHMQKEGAANPSPEPGMSAGAQPVQLGWQGPTQVRVGDEFKLALNVQAAQGVGPLPLLIGFDPEVLKIVEVARGDFPPESGAPAYPREIDEIGGQIRIEPELAEAGRGNLLTVTFKAVAARPQSNIVLSSTPRTDATPAALALPAPYPVAITP